MEITNDILYQNHFLLLCSSIVSRQKTIYDKEGNEVMVNEVALKRNYASFMAIHNGKEY
jgi:hypothetical protein